MNDHCPWLCWSTSCFIEEFLGMTVRCVAALGCDRWDSQQHLFEKGKGGFWGRLSGNDQHYPWGDILELW